MRTKKWFETFDSMVVDNLQSVLTNRTEAMGIAMLMVLFYHFQSNWFYPGFLGVDVFLFLSAYGLCRSFETNTVVVFYKHRIQRIIPLYLIMGMGITIVYLSCYHTQLSWLDILCNSSSLNYWGLGGNVAEWYLSFLLILYLLFPLIFMVSMKMLSVRGGGIFLIFCVLIISLILLTRNYKWYYETAIGRIPIIVLGILVYPFSDKNRIIFLQGLVAFAISFACAVVLYYYGKVNTYVLLYMLSPMCLILVGRLIRFGIPLLHRLFSVIGVYSLEVYVANVIVVLYRKAPVSLFTGQGLLYTLILYFILNAIFAIILVFINDRIKMVNSKR